MDKNEILTREDLFPIEEKINQLLELTKNKTESFPKYLRSKDVRKLLQISPGSLQNLRIQRKLPYSKINGTCFYKYEDIINMLEKTAFK